MLQQIEQLAQNIAIARKRRGESQAQWAQKLGISQPTMVRIERGDPSVAMASYVMCMWLINPNAGLADLIAPQHDHTALEKEVARVKSKRKQKKNETSPALPFGVETSVSTKKVSDIAGLALDPSAAKTQKPLSGALMAADIAGMGLSPGTAEIQKHLSGVLTAADIARLGLDPAAHARKSLESIADPLSSSTAKGLAALLAKSAPKKQ